MGDEFHAFCSVDKTNWLTCGKLIMKVDDPVNIGIYASGIINRKIYRGEHREGTGTLFRDFRIWKR